MQVNLFYDSFSKRWFIMSYGIFIEKIKKEERLTYNDFCRLVNLPELPFGDNVDIVQIRPKFDWKIENYEITPFCNLEFVYDWV